MWRRLAGFALVATLKALNRLPDRVLITAGLPFLACYARIRPAKRRLKALRVGGVFAVPTADAYYRMRFRLGLFSLRQLLGRSPSGIAVEGEEHYRAALRTGKPVVLVGWHLGPVEMLHRIPPVPGDGRSFRIVTAPAFAPALTRLLVEGRRQPGKKIVGNDSAGSGFRAWVRDHGVLAVMLDQVPGSPKDYWELWKGAVGVPFPASLWNFFARHRVVALPVEAKLLPDGNAVFRYHPALETGDIPASRSQMREVLENSIASAPDQFNWSYPKLRFSDNPSGPISRRHHASRKP